MVEMRGWEGARGGWVREWKTPSDMVERPGGIVSWWEGGRGYGGWEGRGIVDVQMLPRHTKRTETGLGDGPEAPFALAALVVADSPLAILWGARVWCMVR